MSSPVVVRQTGCRSHRREREFKEGKTMSMLGKKIKHKSVTGSRSLLICQPKRSKFLKKNWNRAVEQCICGFIFKYYFHVFPSSPYKSPLRCANWYLIFQVRELVLRGHAQWLLFECGNATPVHSAQYLSGPQFSIHKNSIIIILLS